MLNSQVAKLFRFHRNASLCLLTSILLIAIYLFREDDIADAISILAIGSVSLHQVFISQIKINSRNDLDMDALLRNMERLRMIFLTMVMVGIILSLMAFFSYPPIKITGSALAFFGALYLILILKLQWELVLLRDKSNRR